MVVVVGLLVVGPVAASAAEAELARLREKEQRLRTELEHLRKTDLAGVQRDLNARDQEPWFENASLISCFFLLLHCGEPPQDVTWTTCARTRLA